MSNYISRQAAIDELVKMLGYCFQADEEVLDAVVTTVRELPSAQPEIVRCKDCDWWTKQEDSLQGRCALLQMYPTGGWFCGNARRREVTE